MKDLTFDLNKLNRQVREVLAAKERVSPAVLYGVNEILNIWLTNKKHFIDSKMFNGKLIVEIGEVEIKLDKENKDKLIATFLRRLDEDWDEEFPGWEDYSEAAQNLCSFLAHNAPGFFDNKTVEEYEAPDATVIDKNVKISKSFKHFFDIPELVRQLQDMYSEVIQRDKIKGTLCASVHPLDFLSSSENNYKWRSCHALNGEYAGGNLSYMMDVSTIIFYVRGEKEVKIPRFPNSVPWNDKKWRMLGFSSERQEIIWYGRQYPFFSHDLLQEVYGFYNKLFDKKYKAPTQQCFDTAIDNCDETVSLKEPHIYYNGILWAKSKIIMDAPDAAHYNDLLYSSTYVPYYSTLVNEKLNIPITDIGHHPVCAYCGKEERMHTNSFISNSCLRWLLTDNCAKCGKPLDKTKKRDFIPFIGFLCPECEEEHVTTCPTCGRKRLKTYQCTFCTISDWVNE